MTDSTNRSHEMKTPIDLYIVGGFLGAGKTTLMLRLLDYFADKKVGVIVNEFGSIGIDGRALETDKIQLIEINNGSIFCACIKDGFVRTLKGFSEQPIDILLIENSGMADPSSMGKILQDLTPYLTRHYHYRGHLCLIDSVSFLDVYDVLTPVENQVVAADLLIVNKIDLVGSDEREKVIQAVRELNESAPLIETTHAKLPEGLMDLVKEAKAIDKESSNTPYNRPLTCSLEWQDAVSEGQIRDFCEHITPHVYRLKGIVQSDEGALDVSYASKALTISKSRKDVPGRSVLVLIGSEEKISESRIDEAWQETIALPVRLNCR